MIVLFVSFPVARLEGLLLCLLASTREEPQTERNGFGYLVLYGHCSDTVQESKCDFGVARCTSFYQLPKS